LLPPPTPPHHLPFLQLRLSMFLLSLLFVVPSIVAQLGGIGGNDAEPLTENDANDGSGAVASGAPRRHGDGVLVSEAEALEQLLSEWKVNVDWAPSLGNLETMSCPQIRGQHGDHLSYAAVWCDRRGHIVRLSLMNMGAQGDMFPPALLSSFPEMRRLEFVANAGLSGTLPANLTQVMPELFTFRVAASPLLTGTIPPALFQGPAPLQKVTLAENPGLSGTIPETVGTLVDSLHHVELYGNSLTGSVPATVDALENLAVLSVFHNALSGTLPTIREKKYLQSCLLQKSSSSKEQNAFCCPTPSLPPACFPRTRQYSIKCVPCDEGAGQSDRSEL